MIKKTNNGFGGEANKPNKFDLSKKPKSDINYLPEVYQEYYQKREREKSLGLNKPHRSYEDECEKKAPFIAAINSKTDFQNLADSSARFLVNLRNNIDDFAPVPWAEVNLLSGSPVAAIIEFTDQLKALEQIKANPINHSEDEINTISDKLFSTFPAFTRNPVAVDFSRGEDINLTYQKTMNRIEMRALDLHRNLFQTANEEIQPFARDHNRAMDRLSKSPMKISKNSKNKKTEQKSRGFGEVKAAQPKISQNELSSIAQDKKKNISTVLDRVFSQLEETVLERKSQGHEDIFDKALFKFTEEYKSLTDLNLKFKKFRALDDFLEGEWGGLSSKEEYDIPNGQYSLIDDRELLTEMNLNEKLGLALYVKNLSESLNSEKFKAKSRELLSDIFHHKLKESLLESGLNPNYLNPKEKLGLFSDNGSSQDFTEKRMSQWLKITTNQPLNHEERLSLQKIDDELSKIQGLGNPDLSEKEKAELSANKIYLNLGDYNESRMMFGLREIAKENNLKILKSNHGDYLDTRLKADAILFDPEFKANHENLDTKLKEYIEKNKRLPLYIIQAKSAYLNVIKNVPEQPLTSIFNLNDLRLKNDQRSNNVKNRLESTLDETFKRSQKNPEIAQKLAKLNLGIQELIKENSKGDILENFTRADGRVDEVYYMKDNQETRTALKEIILTKHYT